MNLVLDICGFVVVLTGIVAVLALHRNARVLKFRLELLDCYHPFDHDYWARAREFESVTYEEMWLYFWRTFPSFYEGTTLLERWRERKREEPKCH
jgi:hypothetical protein